MTRSLAEDIAAELLKYDWEDSPVKPMAELIAAKLKPVEEALDHERFCRACAEDGCSNCTDCTTVATLSLLRRGGE